MTTQSGLVTINIVFPEFRAAKGVPRAIAALSLGVKRLEGTMLKDEPFREHVQRLCASLAREGIRKYSTIQT